MESERVPTRVATARLRDEHAVLPVSTDIPESMSLGKVSLSVLAINGREEAQRVLPLRLSDNEHPALRGSAYILKHYIAVLALPAQARNG
jgi:L-lactate dehydrogenase